MQKLFSTKDVHPRDRFEYWHEVACKTVVEHDSRPRRHLGFDAEIEATELGEVSFVRFNNSPMAISHASRHIAKINTDVVFLCRQIAGRLALEQDSRQIVLKAGEMTFLDAALPYHGEFFLGSNLLVLKLPRAAFEARVGDTRQLVARPIKSSDGDIDMISSVLALLPRHSQKLSRATAETLQNQTLDLIAIATAKLKQGCLSRVSSAKALAAISIRAAIEARLSDPALDVQAVAAAAGVSVRYASSVLGEEGTSIARLIWSRRLARCRAALDDWRQAQRSISDIAYGWGFSDMTHFARSFRKAYGALPSEYRKRAIRDHSQPIMSSPFSKTED